MPNNQRKIKILVSLIAVTFVLSLTTAKQVLAESLFTSASGNLAITSPDFGGPFETIGQYIVAVLKKVIPYIIALAVLVIVFAGFRYITSLGSPDATGQAKSLIEGAVLGIVTLFLVGLILGSLVDLDLISGRRESPAPSAGNPNANDSGRGPNSGVPDNSGGAEDATPSPPASPGDAPPVGPITIGQIAETNFTLLDPPQVINGQKVYLLVKWDRYTNNLAGDIFYQIAWGNSVNSYGSTVPLSYSTYYNETDPSVASYARYYKIEAVQNGRVIARTEAKWNPATSEGGPAAPTLFYPKSCTRKGTPVTLIIKFNLAVDKASGQNKNNYSFSQLVALINPSFLVKNDTVTISSVNASLGAERSVFVSDKVLSSKDKIPSEPTKLLCN